MSIFELPNNLKKKSIKPAGRAQSPKMKSAPTTPTNPNDLEKLAMEAMADLANKFPAWASGDVQKMKESLGNAGGVFGAAGRFPGMLTQPPFGIDGDAGIQAAVGAAEQVDVVHVLPLTLLHCTRDSPGGAGKNHTKSSRAFHKKCGTTEKMPLASCNSPSGRLTFLFAELSARGSGHDEKDP